LTKTNEIKEDENYIVGKNLNNDSIKMLQVMKNDFLNESEIKGKDLDLINQYMKTYREDFYSQESYKKYTYDERFLIDDVWMVKINVDAYFREKKDNYTDHLRVEKKLILETCDKYLSKD
jgi:hypothetical protein